MTFPLRQRASRVSIATGPHYRGRAVMKVRRWQVGVATAALATVAIVASASMGAAGAPMGLVGQHVDNFMLEDQHGIGRELYYYKHNPAVVLVTTKSGDPASMKAISAIDAMRAPYEKQGVMFFGLDSSDKNPAIGALEADANLPI